METENKIEKNSLWKKINKKVLINCSLIFIMATVLIFFMVISIYKNKENDFKSKLDFHVENHIKDSGIEMEYIEKENTLFCKRGPVVFKSTSSLLNKYDSGREIVRNLVNWFYENVPWGPEIIYLRYITLLDGCMTSDVNGCYTVPFLFGKRFGVSKNGIEIGMGSFIRNFDKIKKEFGKDDAREKPHPFANIVHQLQYYLFNIYNKMQVNWFFEDYSTEFRNGGWHFRGVINTINLRTEQIYKNRFNDSQISDWRYPFNNNQSHFDETAHKQISLKQVYKNANETNSSVKLWSDKKPMFHLDTNELINNKKINLIQNQDGRQAYFNGLDRSRNLSNKELSVWEADNLLDDFKNSWLKPFCQEFNININVDGPVDKDDDVVNEQLTKLVNILNLEEVNDSPDLLERWSKITKYQFHGHSFAWIKEFLNKVVLRLIKFNKKISYTAGQKFTDIETLYKAKKEVENVIEKFKKINKIVEEKEKIEEETIKEVKIIIEKILKKEKEKEFETVKKIEWDALKEAKIVMEEIEKNATEQIKNAAIIKAKAAIEKIEEKEKKESDSDPTDFTIEDKLKDKNGNYVAHPDYPIALGSNIVSSFDCISNLASPFAARDFTTVSMGCEKNAANNFVNNVALNNNNEFWNDVSFLKAFNALPYNQKNEVDENVLKVLAKVMRIDQDIAMTYKSDNTSLSYMWGYMPIDANYKKLVFKNDSTTKTIPIYQSKQIGVSSKDNSALEFDHMFYNENFMDKSSKKSLTKLMKRKAWITDWNLLSDYSNAIVPSGKYKLYFEDENGKHIPIKNYDDADLSNYQFKLNSGSEYDCFAQYFFNYDSAAKTMILNVRKIVN